jgi:hypothetical protein
VGVTASLGKATDIDEGLIHQALTGLVRLLARQAAAELSPDRTKEPALSLLVDDAAVQTATSSSEAAQ